ncbi:response regulator [Paenibacillus sp. CC-CFT747]|nr:response regulator [Paenibacillus sp. CC-CFT747]
MYRAKETGRDRIIEAGDAENVTEAAAEAVQRRKRILIADDDELLRSIIRSELEELGADLIEARDGEEAFALLRDENPDLCILDGLMPRLDGFGLLARMKAELPVQAERTRILMLTGRSQEKDRAGGFG